MHTSLKENKDTGSMSNKYWKKVACIAIQFPTGKKKHREQERAKKYQEIERCSFS